MIDIAGAMLPGGNVGEYQIGRGMSGVLLKAFGLSVPQFVEVIRDAGSDDDVAERLWPAATTPPEALSARLRHLRVADVPPELRPDFERLYGANLPSERPVFDILDADDAKAFPNLRPS